MDKDAFEALFAQQVADPLVEEGFSYAGKSKTLTLIEDDRALRLIRLGGRSSRPGAIRTVLCFGHIFLRPVQREKAAVDFREPVDFPRKLTLKDFASYPKRPVIYRPINLGMRDLDEILFAEKKDEDVTEVLVAMRETLLNKVVPWARTRTPRLELQEIIRYGENAWCERRWIEDYQAHLASPGSLHR